MNQLRELCAAMYMAGAYAGSSEWLERANTLLTTLVANKDTDPETQRLLQTLITQYSALYPRQLHA